MSIVTIHGPYTFGSKAVAGNITGTVSATVNAANGLIWTFTPKDQSQVAANYDWTYSPAGGSPASPLVDTKNPVFTFTAGTKTVILTLNGVAQAPITVTAVAGVAPKMLEEEGQQTRSVGTDESEYPEQRGESPDVDVAFDPAAHTIDEVLAFVGDDPELAREVLEAESVGKGRVTLMTQLENLSFDPGDHTVTEVIGYVEDNPDKLDDVIEAERDGKGRVTLLTHLETMREA